MMIEDRRVEMMMKMLHLLQWQSSRVVYEASQMKTKTMKYYACF
jgi:hypothetical protein